MAGGRPRYSRSVHRIGVVGCGLMGAGIAEVCARSNLDVVVTEVSEPPLWRGGGPLKPSLARAINAGKLTGVMRDQVLERIVTTTDLGYLYDRDIVVEAVAEDEPLKVEVFQQLDKVLES